MRTICAVLALLISAACGASEREVAPSQMTIQGPSGLLFVDDGGTGQQTPVVFIHSLAGNTTQWKPQLSHVRRTRRAIALDLRGHGRSEPPTDGRFDLNAYAADVHAVMDTRGVQRAVLVGHSLGGGVVAAFAGQWPDRTAGVLFVDPIDDPSKRPVPPALEAFLKRLEGPEYDTAIAEYWTDILQQAHEGVRHQVLADLKATPRTTVLGSMRALGGFNMQAALAHYRGPMLTITTPMNEFPSSLHNVVAGLEQEKMTGVSHWLQLDRPDAFNAVVDRFLVLAGS